MQCRPVNTNSDVCTTCMRLVAVIKSQELKCWDQQAGCVDCVSVSASVSSSLPLQACCLMFLCFCSVCHLGLLHVHNVVDNFFTMPIHSYTGWPKKLAPFILYVLTLSNINRFSKLFHCQNQEKICNNTLIKDRTTPNVCLHLVKCQCHKSNNCKKGRLL